MCLLFFAIDAHPRYPLVIAANRDEFYQRQTQFACFWDDAPHVLAGRDLEHGGAWLGITRDGRWAAVTNYREANNDRHTTSRGHLVSDYLVSQDSAAVYVEKLFERRHHYAGFNLIVADPWDIAYVSNRANGPRGLGAGVHALSNHLLNTPWPKVQRGKQRLQLLLADDNSFTVDALFEMLGDQEVADDASLPDTGVGRQLERLLSSSFITSGDYGTRSSTIILVDRDNQAQFNERSFVSVPDGRRSPVDFETTSHQFRLQRLYFGKELSNGDKYRA